MGRRGRKRRGERKRRKGSKFSVSRKFWGGKRVGIVEPEEGERGGKGGKTEGKNGEEPTALASGMEWAVSQEVN